MFYDVFCELCKQRGLTPSGAAGKIGFNRASITVWKNTGKAPKQEILLKISDYFQVSTDYLLKTDPKKRSLKPENPATNLDAFTYAMYQESQGLSEENKQKLLELVKFFKEQQDKEQDTEQ